MRALTPPRRRTAPLSRLLPPLLLLLALTLTASPANAQATGEPPRIVVDGMEAPNCAVGVLYCFEVTDGDLGAIEAGQQVTFVLRNVGVSMHNLLITTAAQADASHEDTSSDAALGGTDTVGNGEEAEVTVTVPVDAEGLYLWCDVGNHEANGMWLSSDIRPASANNSSGEMPDLRNDVPDDPEPEGEGDGIPVPTVAALLGVLAGIVARRRHR